jgi:glycosyltransferase involved in cell wall biosynthesis
MISIITAIFNQLPMNRLFYESVCRTTDSEWELIVVDNCSSDGSREFFEHCERVHLIRNDKNYSYPHCQNQGIEIAKGDVLAFLNNDIILSPHWDSRLLMILGKEQNEILSLCSNDRMPNHQQTQRMLKKWKFIRNALLFLCGASTTSLRLMMWLMYGRDFDVYCEKLWRENGISLRPGFSGSAVIMTRKGLAMVGGQWDPTQQGADYDMYLQTCKLHNEGLPIQPMSIVCGVYHHHFRRLTVNAKYPPFADADNLRSCEDKWGEETVRDAIQYLRRSN